MCEIVAVFDTRFTNSQNDWKFNQKNTQTGVFDFWQDHLCKSRVDDMHDLLQVGRGLMVFVEKLDLYREKYNIQNSNDPDLESNKIVILDKDYPNAMVCGGTPKYMGIRK